MRKLFLLAVTMFVAVGLSAVAQEAGAAKSGDKGKAKMAAKKSGGEAKAQKLTGKLSDDGKTFTNDQDNSSWAVTNAADDAVVKGHAGHHVTVSAHVDADKKSIHIAKLTMAAEKAATGAAKPKTKKAAKPSSS